MTGTILSNGFLGACSPGKVASKWRSGINPHKPSIVQPSAAFPMHKLSLWLWDVGAAHHWENMLQPATVGSCRQTEQLSMLLPRCKPEGYEDIDLYYALTAHGAYCCNQQRLWIVKWVVYTVHCHPTRCPCETRHGGKHA